MLPSDNSQPTSSDKPQHYRHTHQWPSRDTLDTPVLYAPSPESQDTTPQYHCHQLSPLRRVEVDVPPHESQAKPQPLDCNTTGDHSSCDIPSGNVPHSLASRIELMRCKVEQLPRGHRVEKLYNSLYQALPIRIRISRLPSALPHSHQQKPAAYKVSDSPCDASLLPDECLQDKECSASQVL